MSVKSYKVIVVGDSGVGKTSLINSYNNMTKAPGVTIGSEFSQNYIEKYNIQLQIWDCAGQEKFRALTKLYYRGAAICILTFDLSNASSLEDIKKYWINAVLNNVDKPIKFIIVGNKCDLDIKIDYGIIDELYRLYEIYYIETSVNNKVNIKNIFELSCLLMMRERAYINDYQTNLIYIKKNKENLSVTDLKLSDEEINKNIVDLTTNYKTVVHNAYSYC